MINLMVGTNFDKRLPNEFHDLNNKHEDIAIKEVYGSVQSLKLFGSARPDFRLPDIDMLSFELTVKDYVQQGIKVNYTENTPLLDKKDINLGEIIKKLNYLREIGISRITLAHPLAMEIVSAYSSMPIEVSTIYKLDNIYQLRELKRRALNINKVCVDVTLNRDFKKLIVLNKEAITLGIDVELLANEFCITNCVDRAQCYLDHAQVKTEDEAAMFKRYPMGNCTALRNGDKIEWLRARFILPQWMKWYQDILFINHFKITGRTHPTSYIFRIADTYMSQQFDGNLLELWADVKNIKRVAQGKNHLPPHHEIDCKKLDINFLWKYWTDESMMELDYEVDYLKTTYT
jgi:collagenase-like PrtC family protease